MLSFEARRTAFQMIVDEGLLHSNEYSGNVVRRADGQIFLVDWGEAQCLNFEPCEADDHDA
ncbi:BQ2448_4294 [Microbotryum intermedium]|uniref:BQ2448_4294 protein n=1 Tax=Microbotryum intermedium TaxID=269621 RepID=A0A238FHP0_9BASI|nr:BQ2448_4294 [Microbotryum intermedium]